MGARKAITLVLAVVIIIVIIIVATIFAQKEIERTKFQDIRTNMLLIQAKAKNSTETLNVETANLKKDKADTNKIEEVKDEKLKGTKLENCEENIKNAAQLAGIDDGTDFYYLSQQDLNSMGINIELSEGEYYLVKYKFEDTEVVYTKGYQYKEKTYYKLSQMKDIEL